MTKEEIQKLKEIIDLFRVVASQTQDMDSNSLSDFLGYLEWKPIETGDPEVGTEVNIHG
jgi:hypothetical protein